MPCAARRDYPWIPLRSFNWSRMQQCGNDRYTSESVCEASTLQAILVASTLQVWFNMLVIAYRTLHGIGTDYLKDHPSSLLSAWSTCADIIDVFHVLLIKQCSLSESRKCDFFITGPALWNEIPTAINLIPTLVTLWRP